MSESLQQELFSLDAGAREVLKEIESPLWQPLLILVFTYLVITCWNLNIQTIENPDEPRYAVPARNMLRSNKLNDWMVPNFNTKDRLVKPILFYWMIAATGGIAQKLGFDMVLGFRMEPVLMGLLAVVGTYLLGRKLLGSRAAFLAAGILMTCRLFHEVARELVVDMTLTGFIVWTWVFGRLAIERIGKNESAFFPLLGFYICAGLVCATKGPALVALFVVAPLLAYLAWSGNLRCLLKAGLIPGVPLVLAIGFGWFIWMQTHGYDMIAVMKQENLSRAVGGKDHQKYMPFYFYIRNLGESFLPWVLLVPFAIWRTVEHFKNKPETGLAGNFKMILCMLVVPFFLLGVIISKRPLYSLPYYPFLALWVAWAWDGSLAQMEGTESGRRWALGLKAAAGGVVIACGIFIFMPPESFYLQKVEAALAVMLGAGVAAGLWIAGRNLAQGEAYKAALMLVAVAASLVISTEAIGRPSRERFANRVGFFKVICQELNQRQVVFLGDSANEGVWYLDRPKELIDNIRYPDLKARFFDVPGMVLLASKKELDDTPKLRDALKIISAPVPHGKDEYVLALPNPDHAPDPSIFESKSQRVNDREEEQ